MNHCHTFSWVDLFLLNPFDWLTPLSLSLSLIERYILKKWLRQSYRKRKGCLMTRKMTMTVTHVSTLLMEKKKEMKWRRKVFKTTSCVSAWLAFESTEEVVGKWARNKGWKGVSECAGKKLTSYTTLLLVIKRLKEKSLSHKIKREKIVEPNKRVKAINYDIKRQSVTLTWNIIGMKTGRGTARQQKRKSVYKCHRKEVSCLSIQNKSGIERCFTCIFVSSNKCFKIK